MSKKEKMIDILERYCGNRYADREQAGIKAFQEIEGLDLTRKELEVVIFNHCSKVFKEGSESLAEEIIKAREKEE